MELLIHYYNIEFITIIKEIGLLELKLLNIGYFCHDYHKLENFGCKLINGLNKFYIIDWEYLESFNGNALNNSNLRKVIRLLNTRVINENKIINHSIFKFSKSMEILDLNKNIINLIEKEYIFIDKTPLLTEDLTR